MHYRQLLDITSRFVSDKAYEKALNDLQWRSHSFDYGKMVSVFEEFLGAWDSLRGGPLGQDLAKTWKDEIEPYAKCLESQSLEGLDVQKTVETKTERLRVEIMIGHIYSALDTIPGVGETNASKLLHLRLPNLIVMTDGDVRFMFKKFRGETFTPYSYAFQFLPFVKADLGEAVTTLCQDKDLDHEEAVEFLRKAHGRRRSLAKLMDECYYTYAHKFEEFPAQYAAPLMKGYKEPQN